MRKTSEKIIVLGIDGFCPSLARKYVDMGLMPNIKKYIERGAARQDLMLLGGHPTVTPAMWTTLATGAYATVHGITDFYRQNSEHLDQMDYNLDSRLCKAEQLWNVTAEAGKKTLVWHWPGSSWPPSSDSPNLHVVDGSSPGSIGMSRAQFETEYLVVADKKYTEITYKIKSGNEITPCIIKDLELEDEPQTELKFGTEVVGKEGFSIYIVKYGEGAAEQEYKMDVAMSTVSTPSNWTNGKDEDGSLEIIMLFSNGLIRRPCLMKKNANGCYDTIEIYKNKRSVEPITVLKKGVMVKNIVDEGIRNDEAKPVVRHMRLLDIAEDGSSAKIFVSAAFEIGVDSLFYPKRLYNSVVEKCGNIPPCSMMYAGVTRELFFDCALATWEIAAEWQSKAIHYLMKEENYDIIFSHFHNIDIQEHTFYRYMAKGIETMTAQEFEELNQAIYQQTDRYLGSFLHLLDEGWTVFIVSDHGLVAHGNRLPLIGDMCGLNVGLMKELGFTVLKKDEKGNDIYDIDWTKTKAVANRGCHIYLNLKGRNLDGIIEPADKWEVEEEIMTALYGYKHPDTGKRVIACALRNKDAVLLGLGGPESGDIVYWTAEGYNYDHTDSLSTTCGINGTTSSPIFIAAGAGIKENFMTERYIRETDLAPTIALLAGVRIPKECEGAPVYQIIEDEYNPFL